MSTFKGLSLDPRDAFHNIALMIDTGMLIAVIDREEKTDFGDIIFHQAKQYAEAVNAALFANKSPPDHPFSHNIAAGYAPTIGARIRQLRKDQGISAADLAHMIDEHEDIITQWESDIGEPVLSFAIPLCQALRCDLNWLITGEGSNVKPATPAPVNVMKGADLANIGVRIESRRNEMGMSIDKLAEEIDLSAPLIYGWESGEFIPSSFYIDRLAKALNTTVTWLITGKRITA